MPVPLPDRIVEVIADLGEGAQPRYRYGSGCIVRGRTVLTAAHVVAHAHAVSVRRPDKVVRAAEVQPNFVGAEDGPDFALVEINDDTIDLAPIDLAVVDRNKAASVKDCHAVGYPRFAERPQRDTEDVWGYIPVLSGLAGGLLTIFGRELVDVCVKFHAARGRRARLA
jgi:Trypsin-like peptidase domain